MRIKRQNKCTSGGEVKNKHPKGFVKHLPISNSRKNSNISPCFNPITSTEVMVWVC